jgi:hypothetical protein
MDEISARQEEILERARKQQEEQDKFNAVDEDLDLDIDSSGYSGWDVPALDGGWGANLTPDQLQASAAAATAAPAAPAAATLPSKPTANGVNAWGAAAAPTNGW